MNRGRISLVISTLALFYVAQGLAEDIPLHRAVWSGSVEAVKKLIDEGANVNVMDEHNNTALSYAAKTNQLPMVELLLNRGAEVNTRDSMKETVLFRTLSDYQNSRDTHTTEGIIQLLLDHGADTNIPDSESETPLHLAVGIGSPVLVKMLLNHGANINLRRQLGIHHALEGPTPLELAEALGERSNERKKIVALLRSVAADAAKNTPESFIKEAAAGNRDAVERMLKIGINVDAQDSKRNTALHQAARAGHADIVSFLLTKGADTASQNNDGQTALIAAAQGGHANIVQLLLTSGRTIIDEQDKNKWTALHYAANEGSADIVALLLKAGANPTIKDLHNMTPAMVADNDAIKELLTAAEKGTSQ